MAGILGRLGSWGKGIVETAVRIGKSIASTVSFAKSIAPEITTIEATSEFGHVSESEDAKPDILRIPNEEYVPDSMHSIADIPFRRPLAYTVSIYGRDLATGRFMRQDYDLTSSRKLTIGEIKDMAAQRIGKQGISALVNIFDITVSNAWVRVI